MAGLIIMMWRVVRSVYDGIADPAFRKLLFAAGLLLFVGTAAYNRIEGWSVVDSLYVSVITLTTVGYGDFTPETTLGKLFTVFYVISGVGVILAFINALGERRVARRAKRSSEASGS
jgi:voltage-gated potassium channel